MTRSNEIAADSVDRAGKQLSNDARPEWEYTMGMWVQTTWVQGPSNSLWSGFLARVAGGVWQNDQSFDSDLGINAKQLT